jgi:hypothetical protein
MLRFACPRISGLDEPVIVTFGVPAASLVNRPVEAAVISP